MSLTVSPQVRVLALAGLLATLGLALGFMILGRHSASSAPPKVIKPLHPVKKHTTAPARPAAKKAAAAAPAVKPRVTTPARAKKSAPTTAANGLPIAIARALARHRVVVVALYQPRRDATKTEVARARSGLSPNAAEGVDKLALGEAAAGAKAAGAGFVAIDVLSQAEAAPLTKLYGVLSDPSVLVYVRPSRLFVTLTGFSDAATVAQAAANAGQ